MEKKLDLVSTKNLPLAWSYLHLKFKRTSSFSTSFFHFDAHFVHSYLLTSLFKKKEVNCD